MPAGAVPCAMNKPSSADRAGRSRFQAEWADAETRAFLERSDVSPPFAKILRVIVISAMLVAVVKLAWLVVIHL
jgi:hypothetical protein